MGDDRLAVVDITLRLRSARESVMEGFGWWYWEVDRGTFLAREIPRMADLGCDRQENQMK